MATRTTFTTVSDGDQLNQGFFTGIIKYFTPAILYTDTGFDTSISGSGTDTDYHELTALSVADLESANYLLIEILSSIALYTTNEGTVYGNIAIDTKYVGGAYANVYSGRTHSESVEASSGTTMLSITKNQITSYLHTLSANEKANGVQIKITSESYCTDASGSSTQSNMQTRVWLKK